MSLFKQMVLVLSLLLGIILASVMLLNFKTAAEFVQNQLYTDAKNTAHSLGLSLSKVADPNDLSTMGTMINAIYDSGYYERIALRSIENKNLYVRETEVTIKGVPAWFVTYVPLHSTSASTDIMVGWSQFGTLDVKAHVGHAYRQLYSTLIHLIQTFAIIAVVAFGALYIFLSFSLRSLERTRDQAKAIIENQFIFETKIPFTTEFRSVTVAMNAMVAKVKDIFERENETLKRYHELLYRDIETGLHNRRYMLATLPDTLLLTSGAYIMLSAQELDRLKREQGYEQYHRFMTTLSEKLTQAFSGYSMSLISRLNESDFFAVVPNAEAEKIDETMRLLMQEMKELIDEIGEGGLGYFNLGCAIGEYGEHDSIKSLFSRADHVVTHAKMGGSFKIEHCIQCNSHLILGRDEWRTELLKSMAASRILIATQKAITYAGQNTDTLHEEVFLRLKDDNGTIHSASYFIPVATSLGIVDHLDRYMIKKVLAMIEKGILKESIALNLSADFIKKYDNIDWLKEQLEDFGTRHNHELWFEVSNAIALQEIEAVSALCAIVKSYGHKFGIDHFVMPSIGASYLQKIAPVYVKSNRIYLEDILGDLESGEGREGLLNIVTSLGIAMIVIAVEEASQVEKFKKHGLKEFQGSFFAPVSLQN